jgi:hypothetical protein
LGRHCTLTKVHRRDRPIAYPAIAGREKLGEIYALGASRLGASDDWSFMVIFR